MVASPWNPNHNGGTLTDTFSPSFACHKQPGQGYRKKRKEYKSGAAGAEQQDILSRFQMTWLLHAEGVCAEYLTVQVAPTLPPDSKPPPQPR